MGFREIEIKGKYRSDEYNDLGTYFVSKLLEHSVVYKRAVGFFSSSALIKLTKGLSKLVAREGCHIYLVASPFLSKEDVEAIKMGYKNRQQVIEESLIREFKPTSDPFECERLNMLCHLIENGILDIKIANKIDDSYSDSDEIGMYHEKIGIFEDENGDKVAFSGSLNESDNAYSNNFESILVFKSWEDRRYFLEIEDDFERLWNDRTNKLEVYNFPDAAKKELFKYKRTSYRKDIDEYERIEKNKAPVEIDMPKYNCPFQLHEYQKSAINKWARQGFRGLFDMGTGTGKTVTALTAAVKLLERMPNHRLAVIICCPQTHLVEQWAEEKDHFNINFIVGHSKSRQKNYKSLLAKAVQDFNDKISPFFFFVTTNASYKIPSVQAILNEINGPVMFICDEVHNFGSNGLRDVMNKKYQYRLGLSATIDRHRDEEGTQAIHDYFGEVCVHYGLKEAIRDDVLTPYYYYPVLVTLSEDEQVEYIELTNQIKKNSYPDGNTVKLKKYGEMLALKRARIIATAENKINVLKETIEPMKSENNLLIYCGTGKVGESSEDEERQIERVCKVLGNELDMRIAKYTSDESTEKRLEIGEQYKRGELQAVVAIKCLDEGVNIPSIKKAFILASSTNPREYIQRRGRVLRKFKGKDYSYLYDFVTLPVPLDDTGNYDPVFISSFKALARNEVERLKEFASLAVNNSIADDLINKITDMYGLNEFEKVEGFEQIEWSYDDGE